MTVEDRLRNTTNAVSASMRPLRDLDLRSDIVDSRFSTASDRSHRPGRLGSWQGWLVPLAGAAAVVAVAGGMVALKAVTGPTPAAAAAAGTPIPQYYAALHYLDGRRDAIDLTDTITGNVLASFVEPAHGYWDGVATSAGDNTFVAFATVKTDGASSEWFYEIKVSPGDPQQPKLTRIPLPDSFAHDNIGGVAVSPDGNTLAVYSPAGSTPPSQSKGVSIDNGTGTFLRTYSLSAGKVLRTWTVAPQDVLDGPEAGIGVKEGSRTVEASPSTLEWLADGHTLAWTGAVSPSEINFETLDTDSPGTDLVADAHMLTVEPVGGSCAGQGIATAGSVVLTADGKSFICGINSGALAAAAAAGTVTTLNSTACAGQPMLASYSVATGQLEQVLDRAEGCFDSVNAIDWAPSGSLAIGDGLTGSGNKSTADLAIMTPTKDAILPQSREQSDNETGYTF